MLCGVSTPVIRRRRPSRSMAPNSRQPRAGEPAPLEWNARTGHNGRPWEGAWGHGGASSRAWSRPAWPRAGAPPVAGILAGDLWILGSGDPDIRDATMRLLAQRVRDAGVTHIEGAVVGSTGYFKRDWFAPGWKRDFPRSQVALPTALTFEGNQAGGIHVSDPELRAAGWGVELRALDGSGLSYANRVSPRGLTRLLEAAEDLPWGEALREALPEPG